jgi:hypothetical protein
MTEFRQQSRRRRTEPTEPRSKPTKKSFAKRIALVASALFIGLLLFFPAIAVRTPLKEIAIRYATAELNGRIEIGHVSAGWLSPIIVQNLIVSDANEQTIASVDSIATSKTLISLLTGNQFGTIEIHRPQVDLVVREDGSNLEDLFSNYLTAPSSEPSSNQLPHMQIKVVNGTVRMKSPSLPQTGIIDGLDLIVDCLNPHPLSAQANFRIGGTDQESGTAKIQVVVDESHSALTPDAIAANLHTERLPLSAFAPVLIRLVGPMNCSGTVDSQMALAIDLTKLELDIDATRLFGQNIALVAPQYLGSDQFNAQQITATGKLAATRRSLRASEFSAQTEFAALRVDGAMDWEHLNQLAGGDELPRTHFQLDGQIDLAQLARMLPQTVRIRQGVAMESGLLRFTASARDEADGPRLVANAESTQLNFQVDGRHIVWNQPIRLVGVCAHRDNRLSLDEIRLQSEFLNLAGQANWDCGLLNIQGDLHQMLNQVNQLIDTGGFELAGKMDGQLQWQLSQPPQPETGDEPILIDGKFVIDSPGFRIPGLQPWSDRKLDLTFGGEGVVGTANKLAINSGTIDLRLGIERATAVLQDPVKSVTDWSKIQFKCQVSGSIGQWLTHTRNLIELPQFSSNGDLQSEFLLSMNSQGIRLNHLQFEAAGFAFDGFGMQIAEPKLTGRGNVKYSFSDGSLQLSQLRLAGEAIAAASEKLAVKFIDNFVADGEVSFRANAGRVSNWFGYSLPQDTIRWDGATVGKIVFRPGRDGLGGELSARISDFAVLQQDNAPSPKGTIQTAGHQRPYREIWREPEIVVSGGLGIDNSFDRLTLTNLDLKSKTADVKAEGTISDLTHSISTDIRGNWNVKWENVNQTLQSYLGEVVSIQGSGWQPFSIRGPLIESGTSEAWVPVPLAGTASIAWQEGQVYGIPVGGSQIDLQLNQALCRLTSAANENHVDHFMQTRPVLDLREAEPWLHLQEGTLLDQWQVSENDSRTWLKYVAPLIADATSAQGQISASIQRGQIPLYNPLATSVQGSVAVHDLTVGPGPLVQQLLPLIDQIRGLLKLGSGQTQQPSVWLRMKPQEIPVNIQQGRVYHEGFEINYKDATVRTRGSVGFDQTLNMVAEIPILDDWIGDEKTLSHLRGQSLSVPISGTLTKPRLDAQSAARMAQQLLRDTVVNAAQQRVAGEVNRAQQRLSEKVQSEMGQLQEKVNNKVKSQFEDKVNNELRNGLNKLFGGGNEKK